MIPRLLLLHVKSNGTGSRVSKACLPEHVTWDRMSRGLSAPPEQLALNPLPAQWRGPGQDGEALPLQGFRAATRRLLQPAGPPGAAAAPWRLLCEPFCSRCISFMGCCILGFQHVAPAPALPPPSLPAGHDSLPLALKGHQDLWLSHANAVAESAVGLLEDVALLALIPLRLKLQLTSRGSILLVADLRSMSASCFVTAASTSCIRVSTIGRRKFSYILLRQSTAYNTAGFG